MSSVSWEPKMSFCHSVICQMLNVTHWDMLNKFCHVPWLKVIFHCYEGIFGSSYVSISYYCKMCCALSGIFYMFLFGNIPLLGGFIQVCIGSWHHRHIDGRWPLAMEDDKLNKWVLSLDMKTKVARHVPRIAFQHFNISWFPPYVQHLKFFYSLTGPAM